MELVRALAPVTAKDHPHRKRRAIDVGAQRAQIVGNALGQHRHDAVGEIHRIAALQSVAIERRTGPHVIGDVGDGDRQHKAAFVSGIVVRRRVHRVVVIFRIGRIDSDERQLAPVLAVVHARRARLLRIREGRW